MTESLYYTFSTIPQVLAAFLALSGVFLLFKLQELKKIQLYQAERLRTTLDYYFGIGNKTSYGVSLDDTKLQSLITSEQTGGIADELKHLLAQIEDDNLKVYRDSLVNNQWSFLIVDKLKGTLLNNTKKSLISGMIGISFSLVILPFSTVITFYWAVVFFTIGLLLAISSMGFMLWVIIKTISYTNV